MGLCELMSVTPLQCTGYFNRCFLYPTVPRFDPPMRYVPILLKKKVISERIKPLTIAIELGLQHKTLYPCPLALPPREGKTKGGRTHLDGRHCAKCFSIEHSWI